MSNPVAEQKPSRGADHPKYLELAKILQADFASKRDLEWKLSIGLWGGAAALMYSIISIPELHKGVADCVDKYDRYAWMAFSGILIGHSAVLILIQDSHHENRRLYWWYLKKAEGITCKDRPFYDSDSWMGKFRKWKNGLRCIKRWVWFAYHLGTTAAVLLIVWFILQFQYPG